MPVLTPEQDQFLRDHTFSIITTIKKDGSPQSTPVYYLYEDEKIYISVTKPRAKTRNVRRDPRVSLVALSTERPFSYVQISGTATITEDDLEARSRRIYSLFMPNLPENFSGMLEEQQRQIMVLTPEQALSNIPT